MKSLTRSAVALSLFAFVTVFAATTPASAAALDEQAFENLKSLAGDWYGQPSPDPNVPALSYRVTAGGSAVIATIFPGLPHEMVTVYTLDRGKLVLTHYCAAGNQPVMELQPDSTAKKMHFEYVRGGNMKSRREGHMDAATITLVEGGGLREEWVNAENGKRDEPHVFSVARR